MAAGVWVSDDTDGMLRRIDPATNKIAVTATAAGAPSWFADDGATHLLISERGGGNVLTVDPTTGALGDPLTGWNGPLDGTVLGGSAWIPEGGARRVGVVDLVAPGSAVVRYALPGRINPFVAEPAFGDVWCSTTAAPRSGAFAPDRPLGDSGHGNAPPISAARRDECGPRGHRRASTRLVQRLLSRKRRTSSRRKRRSPRLQTR
jgi:hypothetical protein